MVHIIFRKPKARTVKSLSSVVEPPPPFAATVLGSLLFGVFYVPAPAKKGRIRFFKKNKVN